jgi:hypothetical protein
MANNVKMVLASSQCLGNDASSEHRRDSARRYSHKVKRIRHQSVHGDILLRREDPSRQMAEIRGRALPCGSNESQARCRRGEWAGVAMMSYCQSHRSRSRTMRQIKSIVGFKRRSPVDIIASFPTCAAKSHSPLPLVYFARSQPLNSIFPPGHITLSRHLQSHSTHPYTPATSEP